MKKEIKILLLAIVMVIHVHMNILVENPINPTFLFTLIFESPPFHNENWSLLSELLIIGIHCIVTSIFAKYLLKWNKTRVWLLSYTFCAILYLTIRNLVVVPFDNAINQVYDHIYGYGGALERCILFSISQIAYIIVYRLITNIFSRLT